MNEIITKKVEENFRLVEDKLRNSFGAIKRDNENLRALLANLDKKLNILADRKLEVSGFKENINLIKKELKLQLEEFNKNCSDLDSKNQKKIIAIEKAISEKGIEKKVYNELLKKVNLKFSELSNKQKEDLKSLQKENLNKLNRGFDKYNDRTEYLKKEFIMFKNEFVLLRESVDNWKKEIARELKELVEDKEEAIFVSIKDLRNQINALKARNTILTREINGFKGNGSKELIEEIRTKDKKKKGFLTKIVEGLAD